MAGQTDFGAACPPAHLLNQLASGGSGDTAVQAHLRGCSACQAAMDQIRADDEFLRNFATQAIGNTSPLTDEKSSTQIPGYDIAREISRGRQGVVYKGSQRSTRKTVAIKVMRGLMLGDQLDRLRFEREVKILAKLDHPNVVTILDSGFSDGVAYLVMEYVGGKTLAELIAERSKPRNATGSNTGTRTWNTQSQLRADLDLFAKICEAVDAAHLRGVIHRDIKPGNIRIDERGEPRVLDFGLAKLAVDPMDAAATMMSNVIVGTPAYASPEQLGGHIDSLDVRTDVYSLGVVAYELLTGTLPFDARGTIFEIAERVRGGDPPPPRSRRRDIDEDLSTILMRCLEKDPERRYRNAGDLARDVRRYLAGEAIDARRDSTWYVIRKTVARYRGYLIGGGLTIGFIIILGVVSLLWWQRNRLLSDQLLTEQTLRTEAQTQRAEAQTQRGEAEKQRAEAEAQRNDARKTAKNFFITNLVIFRTLYNNEDVRTRSASNLAPLFANILIPAIDSMEQRAEAGDECAIRLVAANWLAATREPKYLLMANNQVDRANTALKRVPETLRKSLEPNLHSTRGNICRETAPADMTCWFEEYRKAVDLCTAGFGAAHQQTIMYLLNMGRMPAMSADANAIDWWIEHSATAIQGTASPTSVSRELNVTFDKIAAQREEALRISGQIIDADRIAAIRASISPTSKPAP